MNRLAFIGWREVATQPSVLGQRTLVSMPNIQQCFIKRPENCQKGLHLAGSFTAIYRAKKEFYQYCATMMEPWDGTASIIFSDGDRMGAVLDHNGLRPSRYYIVDDDTLILSFKVGAVDIPPERNEIAIIEQAFASGKIQPKPPAVRTGKRVAVIGSGPAGLAAAQINKAGHLVTFYERDDRIDGLPMYGISNIKLDNGLSKGTYISAKGKNVLVIGSAPAALKPPLRNFTRMTRAN